MVDEFVRSLLELGSKQTMTGLSIKKAMAGIYGELDFKDLYVCLVPNNLKVRISRLRAVVVAGSHANVAVV